MSEALYTACCGLPHKTPGEPGRFCAARRVQPA